MVHPERLDTPYPYTEDGSRRWQAFTPWVDPWVAIGACAAVTTRLRFTNNVFVLAMRNPFLAAKAIATASVLSRGRVTLALGVGWSNVEYELLGQEFNTRGKRTDEMIAVLRKLWTGEMVSHRGNVLPLDALEANPKPRLAFRSGWAEFSERRCVGPRATMAGSPICSPARSRPHARRWPGTRAEQERATSRFDVGKRERCLYARRLPAAGPCGRDHVLTLRGSSRTAIRKC